MTIDPRDPAPPSGSPILDLEPGAELDPDIDPAGPVGADGPSTPPNRPSRKSSTRNLVEWVVVIVGAVLIAVVIRMFLLQTFWIPSASMSTTLVEGDRVVVNKLSYRMHDVNRGDVVVFKRPPNEPDVRIKDLIKRVVGLPGDNVSIRDGVVHIDGRAMDEPYTHGQQTLDGGCSQGDLAKLFTPGGFVVPAGHVLVMGDNRGNSEDGRCFGPIDEDLIVGRAFVVIWPPSHAGGL